MTTAGAATTAYRSVHKFPMHAPVLRCEVRRGARVLCVSTQDNVPCIWFEVEPDAPDESREFIGVPTGGAIEPGAEYVGTAHGIDGWMVFHIYERPWVRTPKGE
jgi:hypothetical protein